MLANGNETVRDTGAQVLGGYIRSRQRFVEKMLEFLASYVGWYLKISLPCPDN